ncbi:hypothetical protein [Nocardioides sp. B-3]|uniref:hypothetical protein n=1 Tax=Nocardioides sp. B-3 TaxID=2895565 RepID=UPI002152BB76|nr:hypothetical protein [Nocardioides sp. B-3]UUZ59775.1 hypothetical protein LP418_01280 [Nocardioides sp. B-3]
MHERAGGGGASHRIALGDAHDLGSGRGHGEEGRAPVRRRAGEAREGAAPGVALSGERGDRVRLAAVYRHDGESSFASTRYTTVTLRGQRSTFRLGADGFFRLRGTGWFTLPTDRPSYHEIGVRRVQLLKQVAVTHDRRGSTRVPVRRGIQYAITVRAPRSGIDLVSVGQWGFGVVGNDYADYIEGESLVLAPGLPVYGSNPTFPLTQPLKPGQDVTVLANPATTGRVTTTEPRDAGTTRLDGPAIQLPGGGAGAVVTEVAAADLASSAQRLLNVRFVGATADHYRTTLVLPPGGGVAELAAPAYTAGGSWPAPLYRLVQTEGTYRVPGLLDVP